MNVREMEEKQAAEKVKGIRKYFSGVAYLMIVIGVFGHSWGVWTAGIILLVFSSMIGIRRP